MVSGKKPTWGERVQNIDNRFLYGLVFLVMVLPLVVPLGFPINIAPNTQKAFEIIDNLPQGSLVLHSVGFDPSGDAELWPQMAALTKHFMSKGFKIVFAPTVVGGDMYAKSVRNEIADAYGYRYGVDYAILPFKAGGESAIAAMADFYSLYSVDIYGEDLKALPIFEPFLGMQDVSLITTSSSGDDALFLTRHIESKFHTPIVVGGAGTLLPVVGPYLASGQIKAIITGLSGAAEYEILTDTPGKAGRAMDAQVMGHFLIVFLIALGNIGFLFNRRKGGVLNG